MLTVVSLLSVPNVWSAPPGGGGGGGRWLAEMRGRFAAAEGDLVTLLNVQRAWAESNRSPKWASKHGLSHHALLKACDIRQQLASLAARLGLPRASCGRDMTPLRRAAAAGMFLNAACFEAVEYDPLAPQGDAGSHTYRLIRHTDVRTPLRLRVHGSSVLARVAAPWVVFYSVQQSASGGGGRGGAAAGGWYEMQGVTAIESDWLLELAPHMFAKRPPAQRA